MPTDLHYHHRTARRAASLLLSIGILFLAPIARAGVIFGFEASPAKEIPRTNRFIMEGNRLRAEDPRGGIMIFDGDRQTLWTIDLKQQRYTEITGADADRVREMQRKMEAQMEERLKNLPPDQRKEMEARLKEMKQAPEEAPKLTFEPAGETRKTAHGFSCKPYRVLANDKPIEEACFIPWKETGLTVDDFAAFDALDRFYRKIGGEGNRQNRIFGDLSQSPGIPAHVVMIQPDGSRGPEQSLVLLKKEEIPADQFSLPAGLLKESLFGKQNPPKM